MNITEKDITAAVAHKLRMERGLTQAVFWGAVGVQQSVGCRYEVDVPIPKAVRMLLVVRYVGGLPFDASTNEGVADLSKLAAIQSKQNRAKSIAGVVRADLAKAVKSLQDAKESLENI
jgi:hypothetical protein